MLAEHSSLRSLGDSGANARFPDGLTQMFAELIGGVFGTQQEAITIHARSPSALIKESPERCIHFVANGGSHLEQVAPLRLGKVFPQVIEKHEPVGDPDLQGLRVEANPFTGTEVVGDHHRHVLDQASARSLQHEREPGVHGIGPEGPKSGLRAFTQLSGIVGIPRPVVLQL